MMNGLGKSALTRMRVPPQARSETERLGNRSHKVRKSWYRDVDDQASKPPPPSKPAPQSLTTEDQTVALMGLSVER